MSKDSIENIADDILVYKIVETKNQHLFGILGGFKLLMQRLSKNSKKNDYLIC